ncbi:MAG: hypothetical protein R2939_12095 [Kofleriaceae bacterium]
MEALSLARALARCPALRALGADALLDLAAAAEPRALAADATVPLAPGAVAVVIAGDVDADGDELDGLLGLTAALTARGASLRARGDDARVLVLGADCVRDLLEASAPMRAAVLHGLAARASAP